jgi:hypothetical protein
VFYGGAEFSRDTDLAILADTAKPQPACAKRLECVELAPAFEPSQPYDSANKLQCHADRARRLPLRRDLEALPHRSPAARKS